MAFAKFQGNQFRIDGEIAENHAILVNLTASIDEKSTIPAVRLTCFACFSPISQSFSTDFHEILQGVTRRIIGKYCTSIAEKLAHLACNTSQD